MSGGNRRSQSAAASNRRLQSDTPSNHPTQGAMPRSHPTQAAMPRNRPEPVRNRVPAYQWLVNRTSNRCRLSVIKENGKTWPFLVETMMDTFHVNCIARIVETTDLSLTPGWSSDYPTMLNDLYNGSDLVRYETAMRFLEVAARNWDQIRLSFHAIATMPVGSYLVNENSDQRVLESFRATCFQRDGMVYLSASHASNLTQALGYILNVHLPEDHPWVFVAKKNNPNEGVVIPCPVAEPYLLNHPFRMQRRVFRQWNSMATNEGAAAHDAGPPAHNAEPAGNAGPAARDAGTAEHEAPIEVAHLSEFGESSSDQSSGDSDEKDSSAQPSNVLDASQDPTDVVPSRNETRKDRCAALQRVLDAVATYPELIEDSRPCSGADTTDLAEQSKVLCDYSDAMSWYVNFKKHIARLAQHAEQIARLAQLAEQIATQCNDAECMCDEELAALEINIGRLTNIMFSQRSARSARSTASSSSGRVVRRR